MELQSPEVKAVLTARLRRIEGQVRGIQRMVDEGRECSEILQQLAAIRSAVYQASLVLTRAYVARCLLEPSGEDVEALLDQVMVTLRKLE